MQPISLSAGNRKCEKISGYLRNCQKEPDQCFHLAEYIAGEEQNSLEQVFNFAPLFAEYASCWAFLVMLTEMLLPLNMESFLHM